MSFTNPRAPLGWWRRPAHPGRPRLKAAALARRRAGRFGVVTNYRDPQAPVEAHPWRARATISDRRDVAEGIPRRPRGAARYSGSTCWSARARLLLFESRAECSCRPRARALGLSNHLLDTPWLKLARARKRFEDCWARRRRTGRPVHDLADREPALDDHLPSTAAGLGTHRLRAVHRQRALRHALLHCGVRGAQRPHGAAGTPLRCLGCAERHLALRVQERRSTRSVARSKRSRSGHGRPVVRFVAGIAHTETGSLTCPEAPPAGRSAVWLRCWHWFRSARRRPRSRSSFPTPASRSRTTFAPSSA